MTREEKMNAIDDLCNETDCVLCPIYGFDYCKVDDFDWSDEMVNQAYALMVKPELDNAHKRFMGIGEIKDSGNRREFETGAVRDMAEGKGRCDLMPLDVVARFLNSEPLNYIYEFQQSKNTLFLDIALECFADERSWEHPTALLEVAKHFEEGAKKYGENNWQKGLPINCYIDSAVRHYLKWLRGDTDEPHDRAFVWNILCCAWTAKHIEEANNV